MKFQYHTHFSYLWLEKMKNHRKILHIDMDAFFASVEQRDNPSLKGKPVAVGGVKRGVVAAASYEARQFGIHSAMPSITAKRKCPELIFVRPRFAVYKAVSLQIHQIFAQYTHQIQALSLDEAYLDITENIAQMPSAKTTAESIRQAIFTQTQLTASAGVSFNKFLAKIASDINKPNGIFVITPQKAPQFIDNLPIGKFYGIGKATEKKMKAKGIFCGADLKQYNRFELVKLFGKTGNHYYNMVNLLDHRPVKHHTKRKSIGKETTFESDIDSFGLLNMKLNHLAQKVCLLLRTKNEKAKTITIKIKYKDFIVKTRSKTISHYTFSEKTILKTAKELLKQDSLLKPIRLLGISVSQFQSETKEYGHQMYFDFD